VDSKLDIPLNAHVLKAPSGCLIYTYSTNQSKIEQLQALGATVIDMPNAAGKVDLAAMLRDLAQRGTNELHVEAGFKLNGSLIREGLVDEFLFYQAPKLLGTGAMGIGCRPPGTGPAHCCQSPGPRAVLAQSVSDM